MSEPHVRILRQRGDRQVALLLPGSCDLCENMAEVLEFANSDEFPGLSICLPCLREVLATAGWLARLR